MSDINFLNYCYKNDTDKCMELLQSSHLCGLEYVSKRGDTPLMWVCYNKMESVALEILRYPYMCNLSAVGEYHNTALIYACDNNMQSVIQLMLQPMLDCSIGQINDFGNTALTILLNAGNENLVLQILNYPNDCALDHIDANGETPLMIACEKGYKEVALKMLNTPEKCNLCSTALVSACSNNMEDVASVILDNSHLFDINTEIIHGDLFKCACTNRLFGVIDKILSIIDNKLETYIYDNIKIISSDRHVYQICINKLLKNRLNNIPDTEEICGAIDRLNKLNIKSRTVRDCMMCCEESHNNVLFTTCKHLISLCTGCDKYIHTKCPVCMSKSDKLHGIYIV